MDRRFKPGQTVYTINAKTNKVDSWKYAGKLLTDKGTMLLLESGKKSGYFLERCVYETELGAQFIADSYR